MVRGKHAQNVLYIRVQISSVARVLVHKCDSGMLHGAGVNHHVPGVAVQALRPAVVALKWKEATNCLITLISLTMVHLQMMATVRYK